MAQYRNRRLAEELKKEISDIMRHMKDPRLQLASVLAVQVDNELSVAKVFVSHFTQAETDDTIKALTKAAGYMRSELAKRLKTRTVPELVFVDDHSIEAGFRITELLDEYDRERGIDRNAVDENVENTEDSAETEE
ncbi:MAG: 30S ribosome-binding factor RbfA [Firmicutes bacterium]|nr:30S ribosome-binding factor RbfA [Bacillota bacterium]